MRAVISVSRRTVNVTAAIVILIRVIAIVGGAVAVRRRNMDPSLFPLPHGTAEHRGRTVPGRRPAESGPNSLHYNLFVLIFGAGSG